MRGQSCPIGAIRPQRRGGVMRRPARFSWGFVVTLQMIAIGLKDQYGKPLLNGLISKYLRGWLEPKRGFHHCGIPATGSQRVALNRMLAGIGDGLSSIYGFEIQHGEWHGNARNRRQEGLACSSWDWACCSRAACSRPSSLPRTRTDARRPQAAGQSALRTGGDPEAYQRHIVDFHRREAPARSWSIRMRAISTTCSIRARRSVTA